jgi:hypothetical protein
MTNDDRQTRALEGIKGYLGDLVKVMTAVNQNMAEFAKIVNPTAEQRVSTWREDRRRGLEALERKSGVTPEGLAKDRQKEGE